MAEKTIDVSGIDISSTAIKKAKKQFPQLDFRVGEANQLKEMYMLDKYDAIVLGEVLWYILDDLEQFILMLKREFRGYLIINQVFYKAGVQKYGTEYFTNQEEMIKYIGLDCVVKNMSMTLDHETSYETHTVFKCEN